MFVCFETVLYANYNDGEWKFVPTMQKEELLLYTRKTPEQLRYLEGMLKRSHKPETQWLQQIKLLRTGYAGERRVDREWKEVKIAGQLLHDFTCFNEFGHTD